MSSTLCPVLRQVHGLQLDSRWKEGKEEVGVQGVRREDVAMGVLSRFSTAQTMNSMVRAAAGLLFQENGNWAGFEG